MTLGRRPRSAIQAAAFGPPFAFTLLALVQSLVAAALTNEFRMKLLRADAARLANLFQLKCVHPAVTAKLPIKAGLAMTASRIKALRARIASNLRDLRRCHLVAKDFASDAAKTCNPGDSSKVVLRKWRREPENFRAGRITSA